MKTFLNIIIINYLLILMKSKCTPDEEDLPYLDKIRKYEDCGNRMDEEEEWENHAYKCCYLYYTFDSENVKSKVHTCMLITETQYNNIKDTVKNYEEQYEVEDVKIKCKCTSLKINFFYILYLLLLIYFNY